MTNDTTNVQNDETTIATTNDTKRVTIANTAPDTNAPELNARQISIIESFDSFIELYERFPKTSDITTIEGKALGLPSRYTIDRTFGELIDGAWVNGWSTLKARYATWHAAQAA